MTSSQAKAAKRQPLGLWIGIAVLVCAAIVAWGTEKSWRPFIASKLNPTAGEKPEGTDPKGEKDEHGHEHGHDHGSGGTADMVAISDQARKNLGLKIASVDPQVFWKRIVVPGQVADLPGHSERRINATVQGTIQKVYVVQGQTVRPGDPLFDVLVTSELLATAQANLLKVIQDLAVNEAEIKRVEPIVKTGAVSQKQLIELNYEKQRLESSRQVHLQELTVRGLTPMQVKRIVEEKSLIRTFTVKVPSPTASPDEAKNTNETKQAARHSSASRDILLASAEVTVPVDKDPVYIIERMDVFPGRLVNPGDELCDLALHSQLQIKGEAFETESAQIYRALTQKWPVTAIFELGDREPLQRDALKILYASSVTDPQSRSFEFFLPLTNDIIRDHEEPDGRTYRSWRFKPGQQVQLLVPVEKWEDRFVIPSEAVVSEGAESYVFKTNGKLLQRQPVVIEYRDTRQAVIANDGSVFPGDEIAMNQAYSLNLALKKASGSGVDLHAGHNH